MPRHTISVWLLMRQIKDTIYFFIWQIKVARILFEKFSNQNLTTVILCYFSIFLTLFLYFFNWFTSPIHLNFEKNMGMILACSHILLKVLLINSKFGWFWLLLLQPYNASFCQIFNEAYYIWLVEAIRKKRLYFLNYKKIK